MTLAVLLAVALAAQDPPPFALDGFKVAEPCLRDQEFSTVWDLPQCDAYETDSSLIRRAQRDDPAAIALLERRFDTAFTFAERHRIAETLLRLAPDDTRYWKELRSHAENAVRFAGNEQQLAWWCASHGFDKDRYPKVATAALRDISDDPRAKELLFRALATNKPDLVKIAIVGFGRQDDRSALDQIDRALARLGNQAAEPASWLALYESDDADKIAFKYIPAEGVGPYREHRASLQPQP